jgi:enamine deaminase RidA (YjgF/YER057c/UK114 family)
MTASPIYSRVSRINDGRRIYASGLYGAGEDGAAQVKDIFAQLDDVLKKSGSDFHHLAKATYYVSTDDASKKLNELRPSYYDPKRPPAASKASVVGVGVKDRGITIDMIAGTRP